MLSIFILKKTMKAIFSCLIFLGIMGNIFSQAMTSLRYKDPLFNQVNVKEGLVYNPADSIKIKYRQYDWYAPANDTTTKRPLIIWMHGGGFKYGTKNAKEIKIWGNEFARRGYAVATLNYRLSKNHPVSNFKDLAEACYDAVDDIRLAIRYFKNHADELKIDTNKIILGGNSAGAFISLQSVYSNRADLVNVLDSNKAIANTGNYNPDGIAGIINFWGALFNGEWLQRASVPIVSVCGARDKIVPPGAGKYGFFGCIAIHGKADSLHITNDIKVYDGYGHELQRHFNPFFRSNATKKRWKDAAGFSAAFLYKNLLSR